MEYRRFVKLEEDYCPSKERHWFTAVRWWLAYCFILWPIRLIFGWYVDAPFANLDREMKMPTHGWMDGCRLVPPLLRYVWHNGVFYHLAQDDMPVYEGVECVASEMQYGDHFRETMDVLVPNPDAHPLGDEDLLGLLKGIARDIVDLLTCYPRAMLAYITKHIFRNTKVPDLSRAARYPALAMIHGGGYCAVDASIQHHQATAFVRRGFAVYAPNYCHAPEDPFPLPIVSILKFLSFLKSRQGHDKVVMVGESAGGTLATVVAGLLSNPKAFRLFSNRLEHVYGLGDLGDVTQWPYPEITCVTSWYGILDRDSWVRASWLWFGLQWCFDCYREFTPMPRINMYGANFAWHYSNKQLNEHQRLQRLERQSDPFLTLACMKDMLESYPPTFLAAGTADPLGLHKSTELAFEILTERFPDVQIDMGLWHGGHAFISMPPFTLCLTQGSKWRETAQEAAFRTIAFIEKHHYLDQISS